MQQQNVRPVSVYDNLNATAASNNTSKPEIKQQQQQQQQQQKLYTRESLVEPKVESNDKLKRAQLHSDYGNESSKLNLTGSQTEAYNPYQPLPVKPIADAQDQQKLQSQMQYQPGTGTELNTTSHSIAAVRAALNDAKSKFFETKNLDTSDAALPLTAQPSARPQPQLVQAIKPEPKYQNVIPPAARIVAEAPEVSSSSQALRSEPTARISPERTQRFGTTYEQIPLNDITQPSQAVYISTTVPQNMKGIKIAGRHTPTRNSLRHSRMIVVNNKTNDSIQETYSTHVRNLNISRQLLFLQLAIGLLIVGLAVWIFLLAPNASILINPYLSGLSLLLASLAGLILLGRDRRADYHRVHNNCYKVLVAESYVFSGLALIFCCLALVCAAIEFAERASSTNGICGAGTTSLLSYRNCTCPTETQEAIGPDELTEETTEVVSGNNENCEAIEGEWKYLLGFSMALNTLGIFATFLYITLFICCHRNSRKHFSTSV